MNCDGNNKRVLVVGYGNPLRSDDGVGWAAAEALAGRLDSRDVEVQSVHQLLPELAPRLSEVELAILIDASCDGPAGEVRRRPVVAAARSAAVMSHGLEAADLLAAARLLYGRCAKTMLFTVAGQCFDHGQDLSPPVRQAMGTLLQDIEDLVRGWLDTCPGKGGEDSASLTAPTPAPCLRDRV
jgi:hydrogenase maturation protease